MAEDREVLREIWEAKIPVTFNLDESEISRERPTPFYLMVPRVSYFPLVMDKMREHFNQYLDEQTRNQDLDDLWLEYEGTPLKWHLPIGLLWDYHGYESMDLPWNITVHFKNFPSDDLIRCNSKSAIDCHFISTIKEADVIKRRNSSMMANFHKRDHNQLCSGLYQLKFDQFWSVNKKLMDTKEPFRSIPIRLYLQGQSSSSSHCLIQRLIKPLNDSGSPKVLADVLDLIPGSKSGDSTNSIIVHGIEPPMDTPLQWMSEHLSYPDNFLHLCVHNKS